MKKVFLRFYEELNDFLPSEKKKVEFEHDFYGRVSIKDLIESFGVPHTEIDMILVNSESVDFNYIVSHNDRISVYPQFESFEINEHQKLRKETLRNPKFVLDVHLGKLAKFMRLVGFDTYYRNNLEDSEIINISLSSRRVILTRDIGILKTGKVTHGYFVRNTNPFEQIKEIINRFQLENYINPFTLCLLCNSELEPIDKVSIIERIPPKVKNMYDEFYYCEKCDKVYWKGSHYLEMKTKLENLGIVCK